MFKKLDAWWRDALVCGLCAASLYAAPARPHTPLKQLLNSQLEQRGFWHFFNLEYGPALRDFQELARRRPWDASVWNHITQTLIYREMYRIGALETQLYSHGNPFLKTKLPPPSPAALKAILSANRRAMLLARQVLVHKPHDAFARYNEAVAWAQRGTYYFVLHKSYFEALRDALRARHQARLAEKYDPHFVDPRLILGVQQFVAASLPWSVKLLAHFVGYSGSKKKGIAEIQDVIAHGENARTDARVLLVVIYRREGLNRQVLPILGWLQQHYPRNVLFAVEQAEATEAAGLHEQARKEYHAILQRAAAHAPGYENAPLDKVWYDLGGINRLYSRWGAALADYRRSAQVSHAELRYRQAAELAAGQMQDMLGNRSAALVAYKNCLALGESPAAKAAQHYLQHPYRRQHKS